MAFTDKVALITGGSKGIGRAAAEQLAAQGARVVINYSSDSSAADEVVAALGGEDKALAIKANAGSVSDVQRMVEQTVAKFGKIDILFANAGVMPSETLETLTEELWDHMSAVNVKGPLFLAKAAIPHMPPGSHIIFISTSLCHASTVTPNYLPYCANKGSIEQITRILSKEVAPKGIIVNAVAPGPTDTELFMRGKPAPVVDAIKKHSPFNRLGTPREVGEAVVFLANSTWVAGQTLRCNGSMV